MQIDPFLYYPIFIYTLFIFTIGYAISLQRENVFLIQKNSNSPLIFIYIFLCTLFIGLRPVSGAFGDTINYAHSYELLINGKDFDSEASEFIFEWMQVVCSKVMNVNSFFLLIEFLYVFPVFYACYRLVPNHAVLFFLFCMGAFSFYSYGVNGIRNGLACSFVILAFTYLRGGVMQKALVILLYFLAFNIHHSTALPILCMVISYFIKDTRYIMGWWLFSILISLIAGDSVENFFTGLGFDDRMEGYSSKNIDATAFSSTGFRWDFLLYSAMPIVFGYYVVFVRRVWDKNYLILLNTYILCNSFWVMMIRASYSNRFAYLSWFMYALVLAYPCLKLPIWKDQGKKTALILMAHLGFTLIMHWIK